jgi:hypothetical protein
MIQITMDVEKTMQFILEQNAANTVQIAELREVLLAHESDLQVHTEWKTEMSRTLQDLASQMKAGFDTMAIKHAELAEMQKTTQESLNILIRTVQDMIRRLPK